MTIELLFWVHDRIRRLPDHDKIKIKAVSEYAIRRGFKCVPVAFKCICLEHHHKAVTTGSLCRFKIESPAFLRVAGQHQRDGKKASDAVLFSQPGCVCSFDVQLKNSTVGARHRRAPISNKKRGPQIPGFGVAGRRMWARRDLLPNWGLAYGRAIRYTHDLRCKGLQRGNSCTFLVNLST